MTNRVVYSYRNANDGARVACVHAGATTPWSWASLPGLSIRSYDSNETKFYYSLGHGSWGWSAVPYEPCDAVPRWWITSERRQP